MKVSVVVCEQCNEPASHEMTWLKIPGGERLICVCGNQEFTLLEVEDETVPLGALVVEKENRKEC
jgi:hypothetical protein